MPIIFSSPNIQPEKKPVNITSSFASLRQQVTQEQKSNLLSNNLKKQNEEVKAAKMQESSKTSSSGVLKPKYLENKSVFYKESSYIKDLLGEGN